MNGLGSIPTATTPRRRRRALRMGLVLATALAGTLTANGAWAGAVPGPSAPVVTADPAFTVVPAVNDSFTLTAAGGGDPTPTVQWQKSLLRKGPWKDIMGASSPTLTATAAAGYHGYVFRAVFTSAMGSAATTAARLVTRTNWMGDLGEDIAGTPLTELTIPGSHDAGTYTLNDRASEDGNATFCRGVDDTVCASYMQAQDRNVTTQLNEGIRYLDLRICSDGGRYVTCHGFEGATLAQVLNQTRAWGRAHPKELIILDFNHNYDVDADVEANQIGAALTYSDGTSMAIPPTYCTTSGDTDQTCAGALHADQVGPTNSLHGNVILNFENDCPDICGTPPLGTAFYDKHLNFWGRSSVNPHVGKYCSTGGSFTSCFGNTSDTPDALNSDRNTTQTRETFAEPNPGVGGTYQHFFVQFLQTTPDGAYIVDHSTGSLYDMALTSNPVVGPGFFGCFEWGVTDCFAQKRPEDINIVALNFYNVTDYRDTSLHPLHFDFVQEVLTFDEKARTAPVVTLKPASAPAASGWYNATTLGQGGTLDVGLAVHDYAYDTGIDAVSCTDTVPGLTVTGASPSPNYLTQGSVTIGEGAHNLDCTATDGADLGIHGHGNPGAGWGSSPMPASYPIDTQPPMILCAGLKPLILNQPVTSQSVAVTDATSGPAKPTVTVAVSTKKAGAFPKALTTTDKAGNPTSTTCTSDVSYKVVATYSTDPVTVGTPKAFTIGLQDYAGTPVSRLEPVAVSVISLTTHETSTPVSAGAANPNLVFAPTHPSGYEFDLRTDNLTPGNYVLTFRAGSDPVLHFLPFVVHGSTTPGPPSL